MTVFHNALQQIVKNTTLAVKVEKKIHECGTISFKALFTPREVEVYAPEVLKVEFTMQSNGNANITAELSKVSFYSSSDKTEKKIKEHQDAMDIAVALVHSEEIKQHLKTVSDEEEQKVKAKLDQKITKLQQSHTQLTEESAIELLEKMVAEVRKAHAERNSDRSARYIYECRLDVEVLNVLENGEFKHETVRVALNKRIAYNLNSWGKTKQEIIETMTNGWVNNRLEMNVRF